MPTDHAQPDYRAVGDLLDRLVATGVLPGASILIRRDEEEVFFHACGMKDTAAADPLRRDTVFRLFSMSKPITAAAVMALVDAGAVHLDDPVTDYVPELADLGAYLGQDGDVVRTVPAGPISIRQLLTHTAGFSYWFYPESPIAALYAKEPAIGFFEERWRFDPAFNGSEGLAHALSRLPLVAQPGERWHYSISLDVAGIVIERATGMSLGAFMQAKLFEPLGMTDTAFAVAPDQADRLASLYRPQDGGYDLVERGDESDLLKPVPGHCGGGGLVSTIDDYSRFAEMLRQGGTLNGRRVLSAASVRAMMTNQLGADLLAELPALAVMGLGATGDGLGFGLGGAVALAPPANGVPVFPGEYSWGGGASTTFWVDPENHLTVVFMTQLQPPDPQLMLRDQLHRVVYESLGLANGADRSLEPTL